VYSAACGGILLRAVELLLGDLLRLSGMPAASMRFLNILDLLATIVVLAELFLDRLHLLAQVVLRCVFPTSSATCDWILLEISWSSTSRVVISRSFWMRSFTLLRSSRPIFSSTGMLSTDAARSDRRAGSPAARGEHHLAEVVGDVLRVLHQSLELVDQAPSRASRSALDRMLLEGGRCDFHERLGRGEAVDADARSPG
jgi:hypothetical protein